MNSGEPLPRFQIHLGICLVVIIVAVIAMAICMHFLDIVVIYDGRSPASLIFPSSSSLASRLRQLYLSEYIADDAVLVCDGGSRMIGEAWLERDVELVQVLPLVFARRYSGSVRVCVLLSRPSQSRDGFLVGMKVNGDPMNVQECRYGDESYVVLCVETVGTPRDVEVFVDSKSDHNQCKPVTLTLVGLENAIRK